MWQEEFFGQNLTGKSGTVQTSAALGSKKRVGIYFSAHWCPPCRGFTPTLAAFYEMVKEQDADDLEIVFVSSDKGEQQFSEYYGEMPWLALPFADRDRKQQLASKFGVRGIPMFIVLDGATGEVKDAAARDTVVNARGDISRALSRW